MEESRLSFRFLQCLGKLALVFAIATTLPAFAQRNEMTPEVRCWPVEVALGAGYKLHSLRLELTYRKFLRSVLDRDPQVKATEVSVQAAWAQALKAHSPFDPILAASFSGIRMASPSFTQLAGASTLSSLSEQSSVSYQQALTNGESFSVNLNTSRLSSNSIYNFINPSLGSTLGFSFVQPLMNNANWQLGIALKEARGQILVARRRAEGQIALRMLAASDDYWNAVDARNGLRLAQASLERARRMYTYDRQRLQIGLIPKGETLRSAGAVAQAEQALSDAKEQVKVTNHAIWLDLGMFALGVKPRKIGLSNSAAALLWPVGPVDEKRAQAEALSLRSDLKGAERGVILDELSITAARNATHPELNFTAQVGATAVGGYSLLGTSAATGWATVLGQTFRFQSPYYGAGITFQFPLHNSASEGELASALVERDQEQFALAAEKQIVMRQAADAWAALQDAERDDAISARLLDLAQRQYQFEDRKYKVGQITAFEIVNAESQLSQMENARLAARIRVQKARADLAWATGTFLQDQRLNIHWIK